LHGVRSAYLFPSGDLPGPTGENADQKYLLLRTLRTGTYTAAALAAVLAGL
jgi:hypothetical protein